MAVIKPSPTTDWPKDRTGFLHPPTFTPLNPSSSAYKVGVFWIRNIGIAALAIIISITLAYCLIKIVGNWGWWRPLRGGSTYEKDGSSKLRQQYIRSWHGWIPAEHYHKSTDYSSQLRKFFWEKEDFEKIYWDPHKPQRERMPQTWKDLFRRHHYNKEKPSDPEFGLFSSIPFSSVERKTSENSTTAIKSLKNKRNRNFDLDSMGPDSLSDDRICRFDILKSRILKPPCKFQRPSLQQLSSMETEPWPSLPSPSLPAQTDGARSAISLPKDDFESEIPLKFRSTSLKRNEVTRRAKQTSSILVRLKHHDASISIHSARLRVRKGKHPGHRPQLSLGPLAPDNSDNWISYVQNLSMFKDHNSVLNTDVADSKLSHVSGARSSQFDSQFALSLSRRLDQWAGPFFLDPFPQRTELQAAQISSNEKLCSQKGISGRRGSPAMTWCPASAESHPEQTDVRSISSIGMPTPESIRSFELHDTSLLACDGASDELDSVKGKVAWKGESISRDIESSYQESKLGQATKFREKASSSRKNLNGQRLTANKRSKSYSVEPGSRLMKASSGFPTKFTRRTSLPAITVTKAASSGGDSSRVVHTLSSSEKAFIEALDRKLAWLQFELSPGFRGPDDNPAFNDGVTGHNAMNPASRAPESGKERALKGKKSFHDIIALQRESRRANTLRKRLEIWRIDINRHRELQQMEGLGDNYDIAVARPEFEPFEVYDGDIDTAAWILPRPPDAHVDYQTQGGKITQACGTHFNLEKFNCWERIRRPENIQRAVESGRVLGKSRGIIYYHSPESVLRLRSIRDRSRSALEHSSHRIRELSSNFQASVKRNLSSLSSKTSPNPMLSLGNLVTMKPNVSSAMQSVLRGHVRSRSDRVAAAQPDDSLQRPFPQRVEILRRSKERSSSAPDPGSMMLPMVESPKPRRVTVMGYTEDGRGGLY